MPLNPVSGVALVGGPRGDGEEACVRVELLSRDEGWRGAAYELRDAAGAVAQLDAEAADGVGLWYDDVAAGDDATVDEKALRAAGLVSGRCDAIKILGQGELERKLKIVVDAVSASARAKVEKAGGSADTGA